MGREYVTVNGEPLERGVHVWWLQPTLVSKASVERPSHCGGGPVEVRREDSVFD